jgi:hypothetical protein
MTFSLWASSSTVFIFWISPALYYIQQQTACNNTLSTHSLFFGSYYNLSGLCHSNWGFSHLTHHQQVFEDIFCFLPEW